MIGVDPPILTILLVGIFAVVMAYAIVVTLVIQQRRETELAVGAVSVAIIGVIAIPFLVIVSPAMLGGYIFGIFIGISGMYYGIQYYIEKNRSSTDHVGEVDNDESAVPTFYENIGEANQPTTANNEGFSGQSKSRSRWKNRLNSTVETTIAGLVGTTIMLVLTLPELSFPALAIGTGAIFSAIVLVLINGRTYYAGAGTLYCLFTAAGIQLFGLPEAYAQSPFAVLLTLGGISAVIVSLQLGIGLVLQRLLAGVTGEKTALRIYEAVAAILGLIGMVWAIMNIHERATRYGGVTIGGTLGMVLNFLGIELPIPWIIADGVDASMVLYIGAVLIGFHSLESLHTTWHATKQTAKSGAAAGKVAGRKTAEVASSARDQVDDRRQG